MDDHGSLGSDAAVSQLDESGRAPLAFMKEATDIATRFAKKVKGVTMTLLTETMLGVPSTAHILGGACMGKDAEHGVIDAQHRVFGYDGLYVIDGSSVSANPGVNPSLTITALAERAMSFIAEKHASDAMPQLSGSVSESSLGSAGSSANVSTTS
ncbi:MAG: GMC family oxidoreductase [Polyangiales bacterium]